MFDKIFLGERPVLVCSSLVCVQELLNIVFQDLSQLGQNGLSIVVRGLHGDQGTRKRERSNVTDVGIQVRKKLILSGGKVFCHCRDRRCEVHHSIVV